MRLLKIEEIIEIGIGGRTTIWKKVRDGQFPKPINLLQKIYKYLIKTTNLLKLSALPSYGIGRLTFFINTILMATKI